MTIPDNCISLEEAARRLQVPPHLLLFWQRRCGGFRVLIGRYGAHAIRRTDMSLLVAIHRLVKQEGITVGEVGARIEQRGASSVIVAADRQHARALAQEAQDTADGPDDFELEQQMTAHMPAPPVERPQPVMTHAPRMAPVVPVAPPAPPPLNLQPAITPEQAQALRMLAAAAGSIDALNDELHALDSVLVSHDDAGR